MLWLSVSFLEPRMHLARRRVCFSLEGCTCMRRQAFDGLLLRAAGARCYEHPEVKSASGALGEPELGQHLPSAAHTLADGHTARGDTPSVVSLELPCTAG